MLNLVSSAKHGFVFVWARGDVLSLSCHLFLAKLYISLESYYSLLITLKYVMILATQYLSSLFGMPAKGICCHTFLFLTFT